MTRVKKSNHSQNDQGEHDCCLDFDETAETKSTLPSRTIRLQQPGQSSRRHGTSSGGEETGEEESVTLSLSSQSHSSLKRAVARRNRGICSGSGSDNGSSTQGGKCLQQQQLNVDDHRANRDSSLAVSQKGNLQGTTTTVGAGPGFLSSLVAVTAECRSLSTTSSHSFGRALSSNSNSSINPPARYDGSGSGSGHSTCSSSCIGTLSSAATNSATTTKNGHPHFSRAGKRQRLKEGTSDDSHSASISSTNSPEIKGRSSSQGSSLPSSSSSSRPESSPASSLLPCQSVQEPQQPHQHVRFSLSDSNGSVSSSTTTSQGKRRSSTAVPLHQRQRMGGQQRPPKRSRASTHNVLPRRGDGWLDQMVATATGSAVLPSVPENASVVVVNAAPDSTPTNAAGTTMTTASTAAQRRLLPPPLRSSSLHKNQKTTVDVFSWQDSGNYQSLCHECTYLCSTIQSSSSYAVKEASDLLCLLSSKPNRRTLFNTATMAQSSTGREDDPSPLQAVLSVLAWAKTLVTRQHEGRDASSDNETAVVAVEADCRNKVANHLKQGEKDAAAAAISGGERINSTGKQCHSSPAAATSVYNPTTTSYQREIHFATRIRCQQQQLVDTIGMCLHFVSLDCTLSDEAAFSTSSAARRIRRTILTHSECLEGILYMVLADPVTQRGRLLKESVQLAAKVNDRDNMGTSPISSFQIVTNEMTGDDITSIASTPTTTLASPSSFAAEAATPDSKSSCASSIDPTVAGRRKQKRRLLKQQQATANLDTIHEKDRVSAPEGKHDDILSFASESSALRRKPLRGRVRLNSHGDGDDLNSVASSANSQLVKARDQSDLVKARIVDTILLTQRSGVHSCGMIDQSSCLISSYLPLIAISRIMTGKCEGSENNKSSIDSDGQDEDGTNGDDNEYNNPILETNRILGESGAIPLLSQALAETLIAVTHHLKKEAREHAADRTRRECPGCLATLQERVSMLVSLVDGASLLSESNRQLFCEEGYTTDAGGYLIMGLIAVLRNFMDEGGINFLFDGLWGEITLATLRMLTSLTHENKIAAKELEATLANKPDESRTCCGIDIIAGVLRQAVKSTRQVSTGNDGKLIYDSVIFCLNILANVVESGGSVRILSDMTMLGYDGESNLCFLTWLTRWIVSETHSFREAVVESTFGTSPSKHEERKLDVHEDDKLVTAGNGIVLLCCLLVSENDDIAYDDSSAYKIILSELPGSDRDAKMGFLKNTLKAFCNFYHYSIGDLSVAIVAPVKTLIKRLELIQENRRRLSLGC